MRLSKQKRDKISEQILSYLFHIFPQAKYTAELAREIARDEEFIKAMMIELKSKGFVLAIKQNPKGQFYSRRIRWRITNQAYSAYQQA